MSTMVTHGLAGLDHTNPLHQLLLSLDGGGIRGYSALLIIRRLMERVQHFENFGRALEPGEKDYLSQLLPFPCDYFDYIVGSSTGGLSAIYLGRLRMSIDEAIQLYEEFGSEIFGRPRSAHFKSLFWWPRSKYNHRQFSIVLRRAIAKAVGPASEDGQIGDYFPQPNQSHCRTVVVAVEIGTVDNRPFLFRSYDHEDPNTTSPTVRNPGRAYNIKIYKVCRATTAAPGYFSSININGATYIDAAFGYNNPSKLAYREVEQMHPTTDGTSPIALLVNIGTGRGTQTGARQPSGSHGTIQRCLSILRSAVRYITNVHDVEEDMRHMAESNPSFRYSRFSVDLGLENMEMDEWRSDGATLTEQREHTEGYLQKPEVSQAIDEDARTLVRFKDARRNQLAAKPTQST